MSTRPFLLRLVLERLDVAARDQLERLARQVADDAGAERFCAVLSQASRVARSRQPLAPSPAECEEASALLEGWSPERWSVLEAVRVTLVLHHPRLAEDAGAEAIRTALEFADEGELCALYRALPHLPGPERFVWEAGEACRSNMRSVFEAAACDTPYPVRYFDDVAWRQAVIKCLFIGAPLWRIGGLDERQDPELARMALDLADERRSAGRDVPPELWLCLGVHGGDRALASLEREIASGPRRGRQGAALGLKRAGHHERLDELAARESDSTVAATMRAALAGRCSQDTFRDLDSTAQETT